MHLPNDSLALGSEPLPEVNAGVPRRVDKRDPLLDAMKGFAIILVPMGHVLQGNLANFYDSFAFRLIYSFHMPLFFFVSGYVLQVSLEGKRIAPVGYLLTKARTLVVPFLSWYLIFGLWRGIPPEVGPSAYLHRFLRDPVYGYWFLWTLFLCFVAMLPVAWLQQRISARWRPGLIALAGLIFCLLRCNKHAYYGEYLFKTNYFYFAVGYFICAWRKELAAWKNWWPEICIVGFLLLVPYWRRTGEMPFEPFLKEHFPRKAGALALTFDYMVALMGIGSVAQIVKALSSGPVGRGLAWVGHYTLDIYVIHFWVISLSPFGIIFYEHRSDTFVILAETAWAVFASLVVSFLVLRRSSILKFLFLGILDSRKSAPAQAVS